MTDSDTTETSPALADVIGSSFTREDVLNEGASLLLALGSRVIKIGGPNEQLRIIRAATEAALDWGACFLVYWQLTCDGPVRPTPADPPTGTCRAGGSSDRTARARRCGTIFAI